MPDVDIIDRQGSPAELSRVAAVVASDSRLAYFATATFAVKLLRLDQKLANGVPDDPKKNGEHPWRRAGAVAGIYRYRRQARR